MPLLCLIDFILKIIGSSSFASPKPPDIPPVPEEVPHFIRPGWRSVDQRSTERVRTERKAPPQAESGIGPRRHTQSKATRLHECQPSLEEELFPIRPGWRPVDQRSTKRVRKEEQAPPQAEPSIGPRRHTQSRRHGFTFRQHLKKNSIPSDRAGALLIKDRPGDFGKRGNPHLRQSQALARGDIRSQRRHDFHLKKNPIPSDRAGAVLINNRPEGFGKRGNPHLRQSQALARRGIRSQGRHGFVSANLSADGS
ncbi:hypothetical protein EDC04DRAFT_2908039 [Pisolithus marmoratus]|nr:hypothetical protein EDC04DRAFT_2908039 [Pisolithus marmoratus]